MSSGRPRKRKIKLVGLPADREDARVALDRVDCVKCWFATPVEAHVASDHAGGSLNDLRQNMLMNIDVAWECQLYALRPSGVSFEDCAGMR